METSEEPIRYHPLECPEHGIIMIPLRPGFPARCPTCDGLPVAELDDL